MAFQQYNVFSGLSACRLVATANQTGTYFNGQLNNGVGATFTYATGALTIDSVVVEVGDSVALVNQTNSNENGIYVCTQAGATGVSAVLERRQDMQCIEQVRAGQWTTVGAGTANSGSMFVVVEPLPAIFGIDDLFLQAAFPAGSGTASTKAASDNALPILASVGGAVTIGYLAKFIDVAGSIDDVAGTAVNLGDIQAGISGTSGRLISLSPTAANGSLILAAVNAGANFNTTISNTTMGQSSVLTIPDPGAATGRFLVSATATPFVAGEFPVASGTGGLMVSSGVAATDLQDSTNIIAARTADIGGAGAGPISVVVANVTAASIITGSIQSSTNAVAVHKITATATGFDILFSADPGASCFVNYVAFVAAQ